MTQPAKSQEPSMEEILASIRRIIADDDANKTAPPPQAAAPTPAARPVPPPAPPAPPRVTPPEPSLDEAADPEPMAEVEDEASDILDLTEQMEAPAAKPAPPFRTIDGSFDVSYEEEKSAPQMPAPPMPEPPPRAEERSHQLLSSVTSAAVEFRLQHARPNRAGAERPHARGSGARNAPPDAQSLARRQSPRHGGASGPRRDRTRLPRPHGLTARRFCRGFRNDDYAPLSAAVSFTA